MTDILYAELQYRDDLLHYIDEVELTGIEICYNQSLGERANSEPFHSCYVKHTITGKLVIVGPFICFFKGYFLGATLSEQG